MPSNVPHISVCICTCRRPVMLENLLGNLDSLQTEGHFTYSVDVIDNDAGESAKRIVETFAKKSKVDVQYYVEPELGFAQVRNRAVASAKGDFIAFIDDDEFPDDKWLLKLYMALRGYKADGVLGPVVPHFDVEPPKWIVKGRICDRDTFPTGKVMNDPGMTRTGNTLLAKTLFNGTPTPFDVRYGSTGGEDTDFFKRMMEKGKMFVWCNEAPVWETVPRERMERTYFLKRALQRGLTNSRSSSLVSVDAFKSLAAVAIYTAALPLCLVAGQHVFMKYLIRDCDHIGKLLGLLGAKPNDRRPQ